MLHDWWFGGPATYWTLGGCLAGAVVGLMLIKMRLPDFTEEPIRAWSGSVLIGVCGGVLLI